jgi:hypothetical protein
MPNIPDHAYLAGLVDADGCIFIQRQGMQVRIKVASGDEGTAKWLRSTFGGSCNLRPPRGISKQFTWEWQIVGWKRAYPLLAAIQPFLRAKRYKAESILALGPDIRGVAERSKLRLAINEGAP